MDSPAGRNSNNLRDSKEGSSSGPKGAHQIASNGKSSDASATEGSGSGNNALELLVHALVTVASHDQTLVLELLGNVAGAGAGNLDPGLGEDSTGSEHVGDVDKRVDRVNQSILHVQWRRHVVHETRDRRQLARTLLGLPHTEQTDQKVLAEAGCQHLRDEEDVGGQSRLQHDGHVGGVEQAHRVGPTSTALTGGLDGDLDAETLEVDDGGEDDKGGQQVHDVGQVLPVEGLLQGALLVGPGHEQVEEGDDGTLVLGATASVDAGRGEGLPHDGLANVGRDEERDTAAEAVTLLQKLIEENDDHTSNEELEDQQNDDTGAKVGGRAVEAGEDVDGGGTSRQNESEQLLSGLVELAVRLKVEVDVDQVGAGQELENHAGRDNRGDTKFHQSSSITRHHHTEPI